MGETSITPPNLADRNSLLAASNTLAHVQHVGLRMAI
jgi:hypothetical protein